MLKLFENSVAKTAMRLRLAAARMNATTWPAFTFPATKPTILSFRHVVGCALAIALLAIVSDPASAQVAGGGAGGQGDITTFLQNLVNIITGTAGKLIAVLAICFVGIGALMGALSLRAAGSVILGVMLIFSATWIVNQIIA